MTVPCEKSIGDKKITTSHFKLALWRAHPDLRFRKGQVSS